MITKFLLESESWESCIPRWTQELRLPPAGFLSVAQTSGIESALIRFVATASSILQFPSWTMILKEFPFPFLYFPVCEERITNQNMFAQVVKSGYFQLRQTPGVPLGAKPWRCWAVLGTC